MFLLRYFLELMYRGTAYHGWQRQSNASSVQEKLESALTILLNQKIELTGAGRTDSGVHARQLFAHFDVVSPIENESDFVYKVNRFLESDIAVKSLIRVREDAHARFDACLRSYEYWVMTSKNPFYNDRAYMLLQPLNIKLMNSAAAMLFEYTDFKCFSKSKTDVKTYKCALKKAIWIKQGDLLVFSISSDRFLRNMVRAIVGTLIEIGLGKKSLLDFTKIIESRSRSEAGYSVPAAGLYLTEVSYPNTIFV